MKASSQKVILQKSMLFSYASCGHILPERFTGNRVDGPATYK